MAIETVRAHVVLPKELVDEVDRLVGHRKRSAYLAAVLAEALKRERLGRALESTAGYLADSHPEWDTPEKVSAWVRELRAADREIGDRKLHRREDQ
jgi:hypothetical protein